MGVGGGGGRINENYQITLKLLTLRQILYREPTILNLKVYIENLDT